MLQNPANLQNAQQNPQLNPQQAPAPKKKAKQSFAVKPQHLERPNGIQALYQMTKKLNFDKLQDNVQSSMKQLTVVLKTWHFQMLPKYSFDYFLQRCRALGDGRYVQAYMSRVRKIHKGQDQWGAIVQPAGQEGNQQVGQENNMQENYIENNQDRKNQGMQQKIQNALKLINQIQKRDYENDIQQMPSQEDDDSQDLFAQMQQRKNKKAQQKQKMQIEVIGQQDEQPYVPEGFQNNYDDQSYQ